MGDFALPTLIVAPKSQTALPSSGSTENLTAGQFGFYRNDYSIATAANVAAAPYFYVAQGRENTYLQASKRSEKIVANKVKRVYKVEGCSTAATQVTDITNFSVTCGEIVTLTLRAHSSYLDTLYFNGFTRSVTVNAPCCDCGADPCTETDVPSLIDSIILKLEQGADGGNPDNITLSQFYQFQRIGNDANAILRISAKPLTKYGQPCDISANPYEFDRMWFRAFVYTGPAVSVDFIVDDNCDIVANPIVTQRASYPKGVAEEVKQLEIWQHYNQAGYLKDLFRMDGYNQNFESYVDLNEVYDIYYIKFDNPHDITWSDAVKLDSEVTIAIPQSNTALVTAVDAFFAAAFSGYEEYAGCATTTTTTTTVWNSTTTTTTLIP